MKIPLYYQKLAAIYLEISNPPMWMALFFWVMGSFTFVISVDYIIARLFNLDFYSAPEIFFFTLIIMAIDYLFDKYIYRNQ